MIIQLHLKTKFIMNEVTQIILQLNNENKFKDMEIIKHKPVIYSLNNF